MSRGQKNAAITTAVLRGALPAATLGIPAAIAVGAGIVGAGGMAASAAVATAGAASGAAADINEIEGGNPEVTRALRIGGVGAQVAGAGVNMAQGKGPSAIDGVRIAQGVDGVLPHTHGERSGNRSEPTKRPTEMTAPHSDSEGSDYDEESDSA